MEDCIFCKIIKGEIPSTKIFEDDKILAFKDVSPKAPVHIIIIPKIHFEGINELDEEKAKLLPHIFLTAKRLAEELKLEGGYRIVTNVGPDADQTIHHLHFHLLGGQKMSVNIGCDSDSF